MDSSKFYIAVLGVCDKDTIIKHASHIIVHGAPFHAIEVYTTPFDAIRGLNKSVKIRPEHHVTVYRSESCSSITITNNGESRILVLDDLEFRKYDVIALGSLVYSL